MCAPDICRKFYQPNLTFAYTFTFKEFCTDNSRRQQTDSYFVPTRMEMKYCTQIIKCPFSLKYSFCAFLANKMPKVMSCIESIPNQESNIFDYLISQIPLNLKCGNSFGDYCVLYLLLQVHDCYAIWLYENEIAKGLLAVQTDR